MTEKYDAVEQQFGIEAYASPNVSGFAAVLKGRFSDFCVREGTSFNILLTSLFPQNKNMNKY